MSGGRLAGTWLLGLGVVLMTLALVHGEFTSLAFPFLIGATGLVLRTRSTQTSHRFPGTDLERGLDRLFGLLLPARTATTLATARVAFWQQMRLAGLRRGARRWSKELQLITTDGYETASRISARRVRSGRQDDRVLVEEAVQMLGRERARAGVDLSLANDPISMLAYGLGARPDGADLTSLEELLRDLGLSEEGDELRTQFDVVLTETNSTELQLRNETERRMFRDLAGASFVLGVSRRILELASLPARDAPLRAAPAT